MKLSQGISSQMCLIIAITCYATSVTQATAPGTVSGQACFKASPTVIEMPAGVSKLFFTYTTDTSMFPSFQRLGSGLILDSIVEEGAIFPVVSSSQVAEIAINSPLLMNTLAQKNIYSIERRFPSAIPFDTLIWDPFDNQNVIVPDVSVHYLIVFADTINVDSIVAELQSAPEISSVDSVSAFVDFAVCTDPLPSYDEFFPDQWALQDRTETGGFGINIECAWGLLNGNYGNNVTIAIVDNGVDWTHPEFAGKFAQGSETTRQGDHGTAVAGIAAALLNNALIPPFGGVSTEGIAGVAPAAKILSFDRNVDGDLFADLESAINLNPAVINMSWV